MLQPQISRGVHSCQGWCLYLLNGKNDLCLDKRGKCQKELSNKKKKKIQLSCWDLNHALNRFSTIPLNLCFTLQANLPDSPYFSLWLMFVLSALRNCFVTTNLVDSDADVFQTYALMLQKSKQRLLKRDRKKQQPNWFYGLKTYITREDEN